METPFITPVEILQQRAQATPDKLAFALLDQGETETERVTYAELDRSARQIAAYLQAISQPGERAMLIFPPGLDFVRALYGCLYAGVVPIPTNPPGLARSAGRLYAIVKDSQASLVMTTPELHMLFQAYIGTYPDLQEIRWLDSATLQANLDPQAPWQPPDLSPERLAFIQYTSGSTNTPKGVMISYRNLSYNRYVIGEVRKHEMASSEQAVIMNWVPLFHDMGLIAGIFQSVYDGTPSILINPIAFMQKPARWLQAISQYRATASGGPNFAYELCILKVTPQECEGLDLSSWKVAYNSAEPVRAATQDRFSEKFAPYGFQPEAFYPCYGLAEATLLVSAYGEAQRTVTLSVDRAALEQGKIVACEPSSEDHQELVSCGPPLLGLKVAIVDPATCERCAPDDIGEIWVQGENIGEGYWNNPQDTAETFQAHIHPTGEGPFLRTGDLGFMYEGNLYVTGRQKDLIIVRGRNYYPQDVELTVQNSHPAMRPGSGAVFAVETSNMERLVVVQEVRHRHNGDQGWEEVIKKIRHDIAREHGIRAHSVLLIGKGDISKTSSGKIMRAECRQRFLESDYDIVADWRAPG
ncbi:MAG: fatty acyl-AMP ligase [Chloroflexota bacterium]